MTCDLGMILTGQRKPAELNKSKQGVLINKLNTDNVMGTDYKTGAERSTRSELVTTLRANLETQEYEFSLG